MGLRSSMHCPPSSMQCYPSTQLIFVAQSKGMHQETNMLLHFNHQSTSNVMHVFLVLKEMGLRSSMHCSTSPMQCYPSTQPIFVAQSKGMHQETNMLLHFNHQSTRNVMHAFLVLKEMGLRSSINCS
ncbi:unnamed protein product, partial [Musa textilis]